MKLGSLEIMLTKNEEVLICLNILLHVNHLGNYLSEQKKNKQIN